MEKKNTAFLSPAEIKAQTRELWRSCFDDSEDFLDIYFAEKYADRYNFALQSDGRVVSAMQLLPYRFTFYGSVLHAGYVSGLATLPSYRGRGYGSSILRDALHRLYEQQGTLAFLVPADEGLRSWYEKAQHGAFWTASAYAERTFTVEEEAAENDIAVLRPEEWRDSLYVFYHRHTAKQPFMLHPARNDFFAALEDADLSSGYILEARRRGKMVGFCVAVPEEDGRVCIRSLVARSAAVRNAFLRYLQREEGAACLFERSDVPMETPESRPYLMARVVNVLRLLEAVAAFDPSFYLHIGVDGDVFVPENNGWYEVQNGKVHVTDSRPTQIVTPGGLATLFLGADSVSASFLLDW